MYLIYNCLGKTHDLFLLSLAALICTVGVYASFSIARHAGRLDGRSRQLWAIVSITAAGCTAWATHMTGLLAFQPGMQSGFDPLLTTSSLLLAVLGVGTAVASAIGTRDRTHRFGCGVILWLSITLLHYMGQSAYLVTGQIVWNDSLVALSLILSLPLFGFAMVAAGEKKAQLARHFAAPLLIAAIAILHFTGMAALELDFDPRIALPISSVSPAVVAPIVASVSVALVLLAFIGLRFTLAARREVLRDQFRLLQLADMAVEGLLICENEVILAINSSFATFSGLSKQDTAGKLISTVLPSLVISDIAGQEERDFEMRHADGRRLAIRILIKTVAVGSRQQTVVAVRDQSERLATEKKLHALAYTDALTGLANRQHLNESLEAYCSKAVEKHGSFALVLLDLDRFKSVNDTLGHIAGDELLKRVASRVCSCVGEFDLVARLGGDEFAIIVNDAQRADRISEKILDLLGRPFLIDGSIIDVAGSLGIATAPTDGQDRVTLSRHADLALYSAKKIGGGVFKYFEKQMSEHAQARRSLELDLRRALAREEFEVYYQPQVDPKSGAYQGAEALVRWLHPTRGMVSPDNFIPLCEELGLIGALGEWVLRAACQEAMYWPNHVSVAVNLSPMQLRDGNLAAVVETVLRETNLPPSRLELEITESALLREDETTYRTLHALRAMGVCISMDDFGTGYSSLSYLQRFPFTKIKIDQSFVRQVPHNQNAVAIVQAITSLAAKLRMTVTVEGVETLEQRAFTVAEGCDQIQGYLISRPVQQSAIRRLLTTTTKAVA